MKSKSRGKLSTAFIVETLHKFSIHFRFVHFESQANLTQVIAIRDSTFLSVIYKTPFPTCIVLNVSI
jgi:glutaredoxin-related protein